VQRDHGNKILMTNKLYSVYNRIFRNANVYGIRYLQFKEPLMCPIQAMHYKNAQTPRYA
jgi:hypothetical protein